MEEVRLADGASLALDGERFDRIFSVHAIYFWRDLDDMLQQLAAALAPEGKLVLAFRSEVTAARPSAGSPARWHRRRLALPRAHIR